MPYLALARISLGADKSESVAVHLLARLLEAQAQGIASVDLRPGQAEELLLSGQAKRAGEGDPGPMRPIVIDGDWALLSRTHELLSSLRRLLQQRAGDSLATLCDQREIERVFGPETDGRDGSQRAAVRGLLTQKLGVLTGGPGTGKTSTAASFLALRFFLDPSLEAEQVLLVAPTGKAAKRLEQSIRAAALEGGRLAQAGLPVARLRQLHARTLHKTLGWTPVPPERGGPYRHGAQAPLNARIVLVDEASMVDLSLFHHLLLALPPDCQLILLGDEDQLESVEIGGTLSDLIRRHPASVFRLDHCFRSESRDILELAQAFRPGAKKRPSWEAVCELLQRPTLAFRPLSPYSASLPAEVKKHLLEQWKPFRDTCRKIRLDDAESQAAAWRALNAFQVLCAQREGQGGVEEINRIGLGVDLSRGLSLPHGTPLMITRNERTLDLSNGDLGIVVRDVAADISRVIFPHREPLSLAQLPAHEVAWALTIHKSQGSEFGRCALFLPPQADSPLLTHNLLYTAITRAKAEVKLFGQLESLQRMLGEKG